MTGVGLPSQRDDAIANNPTVAVLAVVAVAAALADFAWAADWRGGGNLDGA